MQFSLNSTFDFCLKIIIQLLDDITNIGLYDKESLTKLGLITKKIHLAFAQKPLFNLCNDKVFIIAE